MRNLKVNERVIWGGYQMPFPDELFSSWLCRAAYNQGTKIQSFCHILWPNETFWNRDIDRFFFPIVRNVILNNCPLDEKLLHDTFLSAYSGSLCENLGYKTNNKWVLPIGILHRLRTRKGLMFCPNCLKQDIQPYFRRIWRLSLSFCCPSCGILLMDACPSCNKPINFFRTEMGLRNSYPDFELSICYYCRNELKNSKGKAIGAELIAIQKTIYDILDSGLNPPIEGVIYPFQYLDILHHICRLLLTRSMIFEDFQSSLLDKAIYRSNIFEDNNPAIRGEILKNAVYILSDWPYSFANVMARFPKIKSSWLLKDLKHHHFWFASVIRENYYLSNKNRKLSPRLEI